MILYDSHRLLTLLQLRGSVFPKALLYSLPSALLAWSLKFLEVEEYIKWTDEMMHMRDGSVYSGFTFVLGFVLVFRTSESYKRYWLAATSAHQMQTEFFDACASLVAFVQISKAASEEVNRFKHTVIRLFCLLHAMAMEEIANLMDENFPLIDIEGLSKKDLALLTSSHAQGRKVEIVFQWIKVFIVQSQDKGVLNVPAPILTRVFQELGCGLINYHEAQQVVIWPFPFCYAQLNAMLLCVYLLITPIMMCLWTQSAWTCSIFTVTSCLCMVGVDLIAMELEHPFGEDPNDLPCFQMQHDMNRDLLLLVHPSSNTVPILMPSARLDYEELVAVNEHQTLSLQQYHERSKPQLPTAAPAVAGEAAGEDIALTVAKRISKLTQQKNWANQSWPGAADKVKMALRLGHHQVQEQAERDPWQAAAPQQQKDDGGGEGVGGEGAGCPAARAPSAPPAALQAAAGCKASATGASASSAAPGALLGSTQEAVYEKHLGGLEQALREFSSQLQQHLREQHKQQELFMELLRYDRRQAEVRSAPAASPPSNGPLWSCGGNVAVAPPVAVAPVPAAVASLAPRGAPPADGASRQISVGPPR